MEEVKRALRLADYAGPRPDEAVIEDLKHFQRLLEKWQKAQNLVSRETLSEFWTRHVADGLQLLPKFGSDFEHIVDLGSGGGLPALPLAIALKGSTCRFSLVESNSRKCSFLRTVSRELGLAVQVYNKRIDSDVSRETGAADIITARALAPLDTLLGYAEHFWGGKTVAVLHKGREHVEEIAQASAVWDFDVLISKSQVDESGVVLKISNLRRKAD